MTNYKKENIAEGILYLGVGLMVVGFFVMCAEMFWSPCPVIGFALMIAGSATFVSSLAYQAFKGWL